MDFCPVAVKVIPRAYSHLARKEAELLSKCNFPAIVSFYGSCVSAKSVYLVLEYVKGADLFDYIHENKTLTWKEKIEICVQASSAVNYIHTLQPKIIHNDIKCSNFLIKTGGSVVIKLIDMGLSRKRTSGKLETVIPFKKRKYFKGTLYYAAPERLKLKTEPNESSDVWSLGLLIVEVLSQSVCWQSWHGIDEDDAESSSSGEETLTEQRRQRQDIYKMIEDLNFKPTCFQELHKFPDRIQLFFKSHLDLVFQENPKSRPSASYLADKLVMAQQNVD